MKKTIFTGAGVALVTPMNPDGSVNYDKLRELVDFQIENGTDAIIACGTTGEASTLTDEDHIEVIKVAVEAAKGRVPVIAGTGSNDTAYAIELTKAAYKVGANASLQVTPYYNKTSQRGLIAHFTAIANAVPEMPIILYDVPSRTGVTIKPETYLELSKIKNIVAVKEASGNMSTLAKTISLCGDSLDIYSGNDDQITAIIAMGGKGVISVLSNVAPKAAHDIASLAVDGKIEESAKLQIKYLGLINALFCDVNPIPVKDAMNIMGMNVGPLKLPLVSMDEAHTELVKTELKNAGLL